MADRDDRDRAWRRFDEEQDFNTRPGALDERWGYGNRLAPGYAGQEKRPRQQNDRGRRGGGGQGDRKRPDDYNAPAYWAREKAWNRPGPYEGIGPRGYHRDDERILEEVCDRLTQHAQIDASEVDVDVKDGIVTLTGIVEDRRMKRLAERNIEMVLGVVDVQNNLRLRSGRPDVEQEKLEAAKDIKFPGGPTPTGPAGFDPPRTGDDIDRPSS